MEPPILAELSHCAAVEVRAVEQLQLDQAWAGLSCVCMSERAKGRERVTTVTLCCEVDFFVYSVVLVIKRFTLSV